ncbi:DnaJ domain-containing protein [Fimicolochytrium jonesii]|uniref:DnaJ domain-containing protein n=1 Tax=Fimicolochytrium jonesii TaxID=1396493 RepID=UPI0022FEACB4|nr:DnaJ domain-containing protein [Fimicolochytrium jonesii]KAI8826149.1 DnaJ domain-containing protein [Fimicolochytrium jonesii]
MRTCYYELLGVERKADASELKKAYRRKALELHPDKNIDRIEEATHLFSQVQQAYEVLSDEQERAWYDSHRDAILRGDEDSIGETAGGSAAYMDVTTTDVLMRFFSASSYSGYGDGPKGFFAVFGDLFRRLEHEDEEAAANDSEALVEEVEEVAETRTDFGTSTEAYEGRPRDFYNKFLNYVTVKSFRWHDKHRLFDAPDRRVRRLMEKENKRARELARREFNDAVRSLAAFLRKRDPRYKEWKDKQGVVDAQKQAELQRKKRAEETKRERELRADDYVIPEWAKIAEKDHHAALELQEEEEIEELYCVACDKGFRSEKQFENHERSKKHIRNVELLRRELLEDDGILRDDDEDDDLSSEGDTFHDAVEELVDEDERDEKDETPTEQVSEIMPIPAFTAEAERLSSPSPPPEPTPPRGRKAKKKKQKKQQRFGWAQSSDNEEEEAPATPPPAKPDPIPSKPASDDGYPDADPTDAAVDSLADALHQTTLDDVSSVDSQPSKSNGPGKGKAKQKRAERQAKKAAAAAKEKNAGSTNCNVCGEAFSSRTKLFEHIKRSGHALAG